MTTTQPKPKAQKPKKQAYKYMRIKPDAHRALKTYAAQRGISMSEAVTDLIFRAGQLL